MEEHISSALLLVVENRRDIAFAILGAVFSVLIPLAFYVLRSLVHFMRNRADLAVLCGKHFFYRVDGENKSVVRADLEIWRGFFSPFKFKFSLPKNSARPVVGRGDVRNGFVIFEGEAGKGMIEILMNLHTPNLEQKFKLVIYSGLRSVQTAPHGGLAIVSRVELDKSEVRRILGPSSTVILLGADYNRRVRELHQLVAVSEIK